jgi:hypothetical protein
MGAGGHRLALGDLATFSVDRDEDASSLPSPACGGGLGWGPGIGQQRMQLLFAAAAGIAGLPLAEKGAGGRGTGARLVILLVVRHMRLGDPVISIIATCLP